MFGEKKKIQFNILLTIRHTLPDRKSSICFNIVRNGILYANDTTATENLLKNVFFLQFPSLYQSFAYILVTHFSGEVLKY